MDTTQKDVFDYSIKSIVDGKEMLFALRICKILVFMSQMSLLVITAQCLFMVKLVPASLLQ
jgi:hypothetical protein